MPKNTSFSLSDPFSAFIEARVSEGRYGSASDVVRAVSVGGEQSGTGTPASADRFAAPY